MTQKELIEWSIERSKKDESHVIQFMKDLGFDEEKIKRIQEKEESYYIKETKQRVDTLLSVKECFDYVKDGSCFSCEMNK
jgi:hypothetical protein